ncbi:unspecified product [Leishmania tarentolae]|uniref:Unspecified product n=1 Tax=Leishmania tarentolae TaxID=5689 RepID=A0A640KX02_LEITA|nr:unspecified product [Leishmania tarentolae]
MAEWVALRKRQHFAHRMDGPNLLAVAGPSDATLSTTRLPTSVAIHLCSVPRSYVLGPVTARGGSALTGMVRGGTTLRCVFAILVNLLYPLSCRSARTVRCRDSQSPEPHRRDTG